MDPVYGYQYSPYQVSSNPLVNSAYGFVNQALGLEGPTMAAGWRPSDVAYAHVNGGILDYGKQQMFNTMGTQVFDLIKSAGGGSLVDKARASYGNNALSYLSQQSVVQQAMGGNVDLFARQMVSGATSMLPTARPLYGMHDQAGYHSQAVEAASYFGSSILQDVYKGGLTPDRAVTRGFSIDDIGAVTQGLSRTGKINLEGVARGLATGDDDLTASEDYRNRSALYTRLNTLSTARDVFGAKSATELTKDMESLMGGAADDDRIATSVLQKLSGMAKTLNKDVKAMVESRKVVIEALKDMERQTDQGGQLAGVGGSSRYGATEALGMNIGNTVDIATSHIKDQKTRMQASADMTLVMTQASQSSAGKLSAFMRYAEEAGMTDQGLMADFTQAIRSGDLGAARDVANNIAEMGGLGDLDSMLNDSRKYNNAIGMLQRKGTVRKGQEAMTSATLNITNDLSQGLAGEMGVDDQRAKFETMRRQVKRMERSSGVRLPGETAEEAANSFKKDALAAAAAEFDYRISQAGTPEDKAALLEQKEGALATIGALGGSTRAMQEQLMKGEIIGVSGELGGKISREAAMTGMTRKRDQMKKLTEGSEVNDLKVSKLTALMGKSDAATAMAAKIKDADTPEEKRKLIEQMEAMAFEGKPEAVRKLYDKEISKEESRRQNLNKLDAADLSSTARTRGVMEDNVRNLINHDRNMGASKEYQKAEQANIADAAKARSIVEQNPEAMESLLSGLQAALVTGVKEGREKAQVSSDKPLKLAENQPTLKVEVINLSSLQQPPK